MHNKAALLAFALFTASQAIAESNVSTRIICGNEAETGSWPSLAGLLNASISDNFQAQFCGASVVGDRWILTAAHCLTGKVPSDIDVLVGTTDLNSGGQRVASANFYVHPLYDSTFPASPNDIALIELVQPVAVPAIALTQPSPAAGVNAAVVGWGTMTEGANNFPTALYETVVPIVSNATCSAPEAYGALIVDSHLCAGYASGGADSCQGDSGGPLMVLVDGNWVQTGVVSFGDGCAQPDKYGVYTRLSSFTAWIDSYITPDLADGSQAVVDADIGVYTCPSGPMPETSEPVEPVEPVEPEPTPVEPVEPEPTPVEPEPTPAPSGGGGGGAPSPLLLACLALVAVYRRKLS